MKLATGFSQPLVKRVIDEFLTIPNAAIVISLEDQHFRSGMIGVLMVSRVVGDRRRPMAARRMLSASGCALFGSRLHSRSRIVAMPARIEVKPRERQKWRTLGISSKCSQC